MRSAEHSAGVALVPSIRVLRLLLERVGTAHGDNRRLVRRRARARPSGLKKGGGCVGRGINVPKKNKKKRHLPETGALDRSALDIDRSADDMSTDRGVRTVAVLKRPPRLRKDQYFQASRELIRLFLAIYTAPTKNPREKSLEDAWGKIKGQGTIVKHRKHHTHA